MKKVLLSLIFVLSTVFSFGQNIHKGSLLGLHIFTPVLKDGVSMQDVIQFYTSKVVPEYEKAFPRVRFYFLKSIRGQDSSSLGALFMFESEADRNKYYNNDSTPTALGKEADAKLSDIERIDG